MPSLAIREYDRLDAGGAAPLEPPIRVQPAIGLGATAVRSQQFLPATKYVRSVADVRARVRFGDSTVVADSTGQLMAADVTYDFPVSATTPLYLSGLLALADDAPACTVLPAVTGTATVGQVLTSTTGTWVGLATITFTYQWQRDGVNIAAATAATYTLVAADAGTLVTCIVTGTNSSGAVPATSNATAIPPTNSVAPAITGTAAVDSILTCSTGTWAGTGLTYAYQWKRGGGNIAGAVASTYQVQAADVGTTLTCTVTATANAVTAAVTSAATATVTTAATAPTNSVLPAVTGTRSLGQTLTCSTGTWGGQPAPTYAYQWVRDGVDIAGATVATRVVDANDVAATVVACRVTASNASGSASVTSTGSATAAPVNTGLPVIIGPYFRVGETVSCSNGTWTSSGPLTYAYQWKRGGVNIGGATAASYLLAAGDVGTVLTCQVTATNSVGGTPAVSGPASAIAA